MKQKEKLDFILQKLYESKGDDQMVNVYEIAALIPDEEITKTEVRIMAERLAELGFIKKVSTKSSLRAKITSLGIEYCEEDSFSQTGEPIINHNYNFTIKNSPNSNIVNQSSNVNIGSNVNEIRQLVDEILKTVNQDSQIEINKKQNIALCTEEIKNNLEKDNIPKFGLKALISLLSDISSVSSLALSLSQYV